MWSVVGGVAIGLVVGFLVAFVRRRIDNPPVEVTIALITGYLAFIPANAAQASGVLAVVTAGVYLGWRTPELTSFQTRLPGSAVWEIFTFVINAVLFALIGLQLPSILDALTGYAGTKLVWWGVLVTGTVVGDAARVRARVHVLAEAVRWDRSAGTIRAPPVNRSAVVAWAGMRGAVSLAAALAVPLTTNDGSSFPQRDLIVFLTFCVILGTLVFQGLTLPMLIRVLGVEADHLDEKEEAKARIKAADAAIARLVGAGGRGLGARRHGRAAARPLRVPPQPVRVAIRQRRRRCHRGAVSELSASAPRAARRRAVGARQPPA